MTYPCKKKPATNLQNGRAGKSSRSFPKKGVSGFKKSAKDRDQLQLLQQAAAAGEFDVLLVFMFDRLGRRDDETPFIVEWFTKQGVEVWSVNEGQQRFDSHVDKLMNYIRYWQASGESIKTSIRTRTRIEQLTEEGHYTGGIVAFGYKRVQKGRLNKKNQAVCDLEINEEEAAVVRLIFQKYVYEGYGAKRICNYLVEHNIMGRNGKNIPNITIGRMIRNKGYTGYLINGNVEKECPELRIIEPEVFEKAQELRDARRREKGEDADSYSPHLFTWASTYKGASFERRQAILKQFIKEVRVGRDYNIEIVLNVPLDEFEEFKRHAASAGRGKNQKNKSQNPQKVGRCTSNAGIVVLDKTAGETISIVPKNAAHAILRC